MNFRTLAGGVAAACMLVAAAGPALAAPLKYVVPEASRTIEGGRNGQVLVAQAELKSNINASNVAVATGGGLLGALIDAGIEAERAKKAEAAIVPVRTALTGYDVDALAIETTKSIAGNVSWLGFAADPAFARDNSVLGKSGLLDAASTNQVAFFEYVYDLSADFSSIRVSLNIQFANKAVVAGKKPETRLQPKQLVYATTITTVINLPAPGAKVDDNAALWAANDGKLARQALADGFAEIAALTPRALALTEAEAKLMNGKDKKMAFVGGYSGRTQEAGEQGTLLFNGGLVRIKTLAPAAE